MPKFGVNALEGMACRLAAEQMHPDEIDALYKLLADHEFEQALLAYQQAVKEEPRLWARQRILAQWAWCYQGLGQTEQAGEHFLTVVLAPLVPIYFEFVL